MGGLTAVSNGSIGQGTGNDGNEDTLFSDSGENFAYHMVKIYTDNMVSGDKLEIRIYDWDVVAASYKLHRLMKIRDAQTETAAYGPPFPAHRFKVTIKQTAKGGANYTTFDWERLSN